MGMTGRSGTFMKAGMQQSNVSSPQELTNPS
jgi:hypothetical protein